MGRVALAPKAAHDLKRLHPHDRKRVADALAVDLAGPAGHADVRPLVTAPGWLRLRVGDYRILYRPTGASGWLVGRIVHRRELDRAVATLPP